MNFDQSELQRVERPPGKQLDRARCNAAPTRGPRDPVADLAVQPGIVVDLEANRSEQRAIGRGRDHEVIGAALATHALCQRNPRERVVLRIGRRDARPSRDLPIGDCFGDPPGVAVGRWTQPHDVLGQSLARERNRGATRYSTGAAFSAFSGAGSLAAPEPLPSGAVGLAGVSPVSDPDADSRRALTGAFRGASIIVMLRPS